MYINKTREQIKQAKRNGLRREDLKLKRNKARVFPGEQHSAPLGCSRRRGAGVGAHTRGLAEQGWKRTWPSRGAKMREQ